MDMNKLDRRVVMLRYASISASAVVERDPIKIQQIAEEKKVIEVALGMSAKQIITEVAKLVVP